MEGVPLEGIPIEDEKAILELSQKASSLQTLSSRRRRSVDESRRASFNLKIASISSVRCPKFNMEMLGINPELEQEMKRRYWYRLAIRSSLPDTPLNEIVRRSAFMLMSSLTCGAGLVWGMMYVYLDEPNAAMYPFAYSTIMTCCFFLMTKEGRYHDLVHVQLLLILLLPVCLQIEVGGIIPAGGVIVWSFLCPLGAALFCKPSTAKNWFFVYMACNFGALYYEYSVSKNRFNSNSFLYAVATAGGGGDVSGYYGDEDNSSCCSSYPPSPPIGDNFIDQNHHYHYHYHYNHDHQYQYNTDQKQQNLIGLTPLEITLFTMNLCGAMAITFFGALTFSVRLDNEYKRTEKLLHNVLPRSIAKRLKEGESHIIEHFEGVCILFADLVGFTKAASQFHPNFLIGKFLSDVFSAWDQLCDGRNMEKIKTIGDAFMAVGGIEPNGRTGAEMSADMVMLGLEMQKALDEINSRYGVEFQVRMGLHSGPVIAGVIGVRKFAFDVWGDAVNTASRMESHGVPGCMHISAATYEKIKEPLSHYDFQCRGEIQIKGKGTMVTYLLEMPTLIEEEEMEETEEDEMMIEEEEYQSENSSTTNNSSITSTGTPGLTASTTSNGSL